MSREQRRSERLKLEVEGFFIFRDQNGEGIGSKALVKDISQHGVYLISDVRPALGGQVELLLKWPQEGSTKERLLELYGKVVRLENLSTETYGFAVDFDTPIVDRKVQGGKEPPAA